RGGRLANDRFCHLGEHEVRLSLFFRMRGECKALAPVWQFLIPENRELSKSEKQDAFICAGEYCFFAASAYNYSGIFASFTGMVFNALCPAPVFIRLDLSGNAGP